MGVGVVFLADFPLILSLLKHADVGAFLNQKIRIPNKINSLNSSIDIRGLTYKMVLMIIPYMEGMEIVHIVSYRHI